MEIQLLTKQYYSPSDRLSKSQNLAIVRIFLNAAIACIAHTRELIPWTSPCFQTRYISQLKLDVSDATDLYADFCNGSVDRNGGSESQEFRVLRRGKNEKADNILDMIDAGVMDAISQNFLEAFQICIVADTGDPASTMEFYNFTFTYELDAVSQINLASQEHAFNIKEIHRSFTSAIRALLRSLRDLPRLPRRRSLGVSLLYNKNCPQDYQPHGFVDTKKPHKWPLRGSWEDLWQKIPPPVSQFTTGLWEVVICVRNLQSINGMNDSQLQDSKISAQIQQMQKTSSRNGDLISTAQTSQNLNVLHGACQLIPAPKAGSPSPVLPRQHVQDKPCPPTGNHLESPTFQLSLPSEISRSDKKPTNSLAKLSVASKNRRRRNVVAGKIAELIVQARAIENQHHGLNHLFDQQQLGIGRIRRVNRDGVIRCECRSQHRSEQTLFCELCGTKQHKVCYGYELLRPGCLPEDHFCYECLLLPREDNISYRMPGVVQMRLALQHLARQQSGEVQIGQGFLQAVFSDRDNCTIEFLQLIDRLTDEGYLSKRIDGVARILGNGMIEEAQTAYLDPLAGITHHYQIVRDGDTFEKRKSDIMKALKLYVGDRHFSLKDTSNSSYDRVHVRGNSDQEVIRWGFYASWKRKRVDSPDSAAGRQKISVSNTFVNVNRSTPAETSSISDALQEAFSEAEWDWSLDKCLSSGNANFQ